MKPARSTSRTHPRTAPERHLAERRLVGEVVAGRRSARRGRDGEALFNRAFTLIELMLVVAILGIAMAMSYPSIAKALHRAPLSQAAWDVMEGCRKARASAILQGSTMELRIYPDHIEVGASPADADPGSLATPTKPVLVAEQDEPKPAAGFTAQLSDRVAVEQLKVNLIEVVATDIAARVRFYPNGTCDEFTMVLLGDGERRKITLESVTALAGVEIVQ